MRTPLLLLALAGHSLLCVFASTPPRLSVEEYRDKVYASWLGQCAGNIYGLPHEQKYFYEPGPDNFPLGYSGYGAAMLKKHNGAFSDDDTDIEYMYLLAMERHGVEPTYRQLADSWRRHIRDKVWLANRAAVGMMLYGWDPPWTGRRPYNMHWFQIDPQLVNEIWAVTAPGMVRYSAAKSEWAARIMADDWAFQPTVAYAAMYSAAFFERDLRALLDAAKRALPPGAKFAKTIDRMIEIHDKHPADWKAARKEALPSLYFGEPEESRTVTNANLNAALAVLALLYGGGDFQKTMDIGCALGFDADNQTATLGGLLGIINGTQGIPRHLLFPYPELEWKEPFNDRYINVTRVDLPDASLKDMAQRTALLGEKVILAAGGKKVVMDGKSYYEIASDAAFTPPFEFPAGPDPEIAAGAPVDFVFLASGAGPHPDWKIVQGKLPAGLTFAQGRLSGVTQDAPGVYTVTIEVRSGKPFRRRDFPLLVRGQNLAQHAQRILSPLSQPDFSLWKSIPSDTPRLYYAASPEALRDGKRRGAGASFISLGAGAAPRDDYYGYEWDQPQRIGVLSLTTGVIEDISGWFTSLSVEYRDAGGQWRAVRGATTHPAFPEGDVIPAKAQFVEYLFSFEPVETTAIRVGGPAGRVNAGTKDLPRFTSVTEVSVYGPVKGFK